MAEKEPLQTSRYTKTKLVTDSGVRPGVLRLERWEVPEIDLTATFLHTVDVSEVARPDLISYRVYGDSEYWWAIMLVNSISNPLEELTAGRVLTMPTLAAISRALSSEMKAV